MFSKYQVLPLPGHTSAAEVQQIPEAKFRVAFPSSTCQQVLPQWFGSPALRREMSQRRLLHKMLTGPSYAAPHARNALDTSPVVVPASSPVLVPSLSSVVVPASSQVVVPASSSSASITDQSHHIRYLSTAVQETANPADGHCGNRHGVQLLRDRGSHGSVHPRQQR